MSGLGLSMRAGNGTQARLDRRQEISKRDEEIPVPRLRNLLPQQMRRQRACITKTERIIGISSQNISE